MRIYNGKNSQVDMPLANGQRITIASKSVSGDIMPSNEFLSLLVTSYDYSEIALIVSGPFEINMCSQVSCCAGFVVNSLEEAIERFATKEETAKEEVVSKEEINPAKLEPVAEPEVISIKEEDPVGEPQEQINTDNNQGKKKPAKGFNGKKNK